jgi:Glycosyltransferase like family 2
MNNKTGIVVPTYKREELLHCCLRRIRDCEGYMPIHVFPDRGTAESKEVLAIAAEFRATVHFVPKHNFYGNTANTMMALAWAYSKGFDFVHYIESDVFIHPDYFSWHQRMHEEHPDIFASMAWVFNRHTPLVDDVLFQPWYYAIGVCFPRRTLARIAKHSIAWYFSDMAGYIAKVFPNSNLNSPFGIAHFEQDGLIQRVLAENPEDMTVSPGLAKCSHMGFVRSYGAGDPNDELSLAMNMPADASLSERVARIEELYEDHYWRVQQFGADIVEREIGRKLPARSFRYRITLEGGWESEFTSQLTKGRLPARINSVTLPPNAKVEELAL